MSGSDYSRACTDHAYDVIPGWCASTGPQMRNCASGNLEIPGSIPDLGFTRGRQIWLSKSATADLDAHRPGMTGDPGMTEERHLSPQPFRRALLGKRLGALDIVLRGSHRLHRRVFALLGHRLFEGNLHALLDRLLGRADRHRRVLADRLGPAFGGGKRLALRNHLVDEAELETLPGRDMTRGQDHAHRALQADLPRQALQAAGKRRESDARLG